MRWLDGTTVSMVMSLSKLQKRLLDSVGEGEVGDVLREQHQNMYIIYGETDRQPRLDA